MTHNDYLELIKTIAYHDDLYYNQSQPVITDSEYDKLYFQITTYENEHPDLISPTSPTQLVSKESFTNEIEHPFPLLSLKKANEYAQVEQYLNKFKTLTDQKDIKNEYKTDSFIVQLKEDGLTIAMYYNWFKSNFIAATRGGGGKGQNVSLQMAKHNQHLKEKAIVRGEAILSTKAFDDMNADGKYMNPRNAVSGLIHREETAQNIRLVAYNIENAEDFGITTEKEMLQQLKDWGFETPHLQKYFDNTDAGKKALIDYIKSFEKNNERETIDHDIDGLVIKPNYIKNRRELGFTGHHPRNQLAYKFASADAITTLKEVIWQHGAKGNMTPVAIFDPITILGAKITKASLATVNTFKKKDLMINDKILVRRSNDVIPQIVKAFPEERTGDEVAIEIPENTHFEGEFLIADYESDEQKLARWSSFVKKDGMDIKRLSSKSIGILAENNLINLDKFSSLWQLVDKKEEIVALDGWQDKKVDYLLEQLRTPRKITMAKLMYAMTIPTIGHKVSSLLAKYYPSINDLLNDTSPYSSYDAFVAENGTLAESYKNTLLDNRELFEDIQQFVTIETPKETTTQVSNDSLAGKTYVITGKSDIMSRNDLTTIIVEKGGKISSAVSKNTTAVINLSDTVNSSKAKKAIALNIPLISLEESHLLTNDN